MAKQFIPEKEKVFVDRMPYHELYPAQQALFDSAKRTDELFVFWARQVGKSNVVSYILHDRLINNSFNGELYVMISPSESEIYDFFVDDIMLEAFGGRAVAYDINCVYIIPPEKWLKDMQGAWAIKEELKEEWFRNEWAVEHNGKIFVKYFRRDLSITGGKKKKQQHYEGELFTGARLLLAAATHHLPNIIRGRKLSGVYGEEVAQWPKNPLGIIMPTLIKQKGWLMLVGTPNSENPQNWIYQDFVKPVTTSMFVKKTTKLGVDWYRTEVEKEVTLSLEDFEKGHYLPSEIKTSSKKVKRTQVLSIGDFEKIFPYVFAGTEVFDDVQMARRQPHKIVYETDDEGNIVWDMDNAVYSKAKKKTIKFPKYKIIPIPGKVGTAGISEIQYQMEYRMNFKAGGGHIFTDWNRETNVINAADFNPNLYRTITGYDHGTLESIIYDGTDEGTKSAAAMVKIACIPQGGEYQYVIYDEKYIDNPTSEHIASHVLAELNGGHPIVADNAIWSRVMKGSPTTYENIINANDELRIHPRARTNYGIFKCYKREMNGRFDLWNKWFSQSQLTNANTYFSHPSMPSGTYGRKLMITSNCVKLINLFESWYRARVNDYGEWKAVKMRDDLYDAADYPIEIMEERSLARTKDEIERIWRDYTSYTRLKQQEENIYFPVGMNTLPSMNRYKQRF